MRIVKFLFDLLLSFFENIFFIFFCNRFCCFFYCLCDGVNYSQNVKLCHSIYLFLLGLFLILLYYVVLFEFNMQVTLLVCIIGLFGMQLLVFTL